MNIRLVSKSRVRGFVFVIAGALMWPSAVTAGEIRSVTFDSNALGREWSYTVYLPDGYETSGLAYPVLYLLHGNGGTHTDWVRQGNIEATTDALIADGEIPPAVIVMPDAGSTWYVDRKESMETAIIQELIPRVESEYRVIPDRTNRLVGGLSMGGYGTMRFAMKYPEMFGAAALLSPAIYDPEPPANSAARNVGVFGDATYDTDTWSAMNYPALWPGYLAKGMPVPMYINSGDDDVFRIEMEVAEFYTILRANNQPAELRIVDGGHTWDVWRSTIGDAMRYIFSHGAAAAPAR
jgi:enterochelin esterase-like enzyme